MTINKLTPQLIQEIYEEAVSAECFERENVDSACFDLLCKMDEAGGLSHVVRKLIDMTRAKDAEIPEYRKDLAGMGVKPVLSMQFKNGWPVTGTAGVISNSPRIADGYHDFYTAPPAPEREQIRNEHAEWSRLTFGEVGPIGPLKHLAKEALEAADAPGDLHEWADMQFLLWDAQRAAGITDEQITQAMIEKLEVNKARQWQKPEDGEPRFHIKGSENDA